MSTQEGRPFVIGDENNLYIVMQQYNGWTAFCFKGYAITEFEQHIERPMETVHFMDGRKEFISQQTIIEGMLNLQALNVEYRHADTFEGLGILPPEPTILQDIQNTIKKLEKRRTEEGTD